MQWKCLLGLNKWLINPFTSQEALPRESCLVNNLIIGGPEKKHWWVHQIIFMRLVCILHLFLSFYPHSRLSSWIFSWLTRNCESLPRWRHWATGPCSASRLTPCSPEKIIVFFKLVIITVDYVADTWWYLLRTLFHWNLYMYYKYWLFQLQWN